jgi:hypothetical protein
MCVVREPSVPEQDRDGNITLTLNTIYAIYLSFKSPLPAYNNSLVVTGKSFSQPVVTGRHSGDNENQYLISFGKLFKLERR